MLFRSVTVQGDVTSNVDIQGTGLLQLKGSVLQNVDMGGFTIPNLELDNAANATLLNTLPFNCNNPVPCISTLLVTSPCTVTVAPGCIKKMALSILSWANKWLAKKQQIVENIIFFI